MRYIFTFTVFSISTLITACGAHERVSDEEQADTFQEMLQADAQCSQACAQMNSVCGAMPPGCRTTCTEKFTTEQRLCLMEASSCAGAGTCTSEGPLAQLQH
ncbi:MAG: hypothetical protein AAF355_04175 [Myxococcota bacterium]